MRHLHILEMHSVFYPNYICQAGMRWPSWRYSVDSRLFLTTYSRKKPLCITPTSAGIWRSHQVRGGQDSKYQEAHICEAGKWRL